jgi:tetratricopeptide (TPR) repeat protein
MIQNNLGLLYRDRIKEDKSINIELAIACFQSALEAYTRQSQPRLWAVTQTNLGQTYEIRIQGDRIENLDKAIRAYRQALTVLNDKELSQQRRQVEQLLVTAESKLLAERKRALMEVNDSGILIYQLLWKEKCV